MPAMNTSYLAEISAEAATGEIARIYEQIRRLTGVPLVALIYRHLATHPQALQALWRSVSPLLESGELQEGAWTIARGAWNAPAPAADADLRALGAAELVRAGDVIDVYNRANPVNFAVVCVIRAAARAPGAAASIGVPGWSAPARIASIAPIPPMDALDPRARALVDGFAKGAGPGEPALVPTLYRNIAHWRPLLELAAREIQPRLAQGAFEPAIRAFRQGVERLAAELVARHAVAVDPTLTTPQLNQVFDRFSPVIPEMVVVGQFLRRALDQACSRACGPGATDRTGGHPSDH
jgi:hypothetical protein